MAGTSEPIRACELPDQTDQVIASTGWQFVDTDIGIRQGTVDSDGSG
ncbi:MAG: hypothetical protein OXH47_07375 [Paracoccaceae bacterium]|nr:hypothetical protein [Paracoccaceae bacterium]